MTNMICLFLCLLSICLVDCQFGLLTSIGESISTDVLRQKRYVDNEVSSCPTVNNMPARCVDLVKQCPPLHEAAIIHKNNPKFIEILKQLQCGESDAKDFQVCCAVEWIPKPQVAQPPATKPPMTKPPAIKPQKSQPPKTKPQKSKPPKTKPQKSQPPKTKPPKTKPQKIQPPKAKPSMTKPPAIKPQKIQPPKTNPSMTKLQKSQPPKTKPPKTKPQKSQPPKTKPPKTKPQKSQPPKTKPSMTKPPAIKPQKIQPPKTKPSMTKPPAIKPQKIQPPKTKPSMTKLQVTQRPTTKSPMIKPPATKTQVTQPSEQSCKSLKAGYLPGRCVSLIDCSSLYKKVIEHSQDPAVRKEMLQVHCGWVDNDAQQPQVCCPLESIANPGRTQPSDEIPQGDARSQDSEDFVDALPSPPVCGPYYNGAVRRVVGGRMARLNMFPWMALLGYCRRWGFDWKCGGSLISTRHVLTAAHCIHGNEKNLLQVRLGELDLARDDDGATPIDIPIKKMIIHEKFVPKTNENDIGMLTLTTKVEYTGSIKPLCIPMTPEMRSTNFEFFGIPVLAGWGQIKLGGNSSSHLQYIQVPITSTEECNEIYKKDNKNFKPLDNRSLCAGYKEGRKDSCSGDSGGPLMQSFRNHETGKSNFYQTGIISFGKGCGSPGYPGIYVRVTEYIPWIVKQTTGKIIF